jgi:flagellar hook protein FlgE
MLDSIYIGMSGMEGFSKGLQVISNNVANLNTPGFKSSTLQFTDAYYLQSALGGQDQNGQAPQTQFGSGLTTLATVVDFQSGQLQQTNNSLDVAVSGSGYLIQQDKDGQHQAYTRDGQMQFNSDGALVSTTTGKYVMGYPAGGSQTLAHITLDGLRTNPAKATSTVTFSGNISTSTSTSTNGGPAHTELSSVVINDAVGALHTLKVTFTNKGPDSPDEWTVTVSEGDKTLGTGTIGFTNANPKPDENSVSFTYTPTDGAPFDVKLDFSSNVTSFDSGNLSTLAVASQNGFGAGSISKTSFDSDGKLTITYSNGQTATGAQLALAEFDSPQRLKQEAAGQFTANADAGVRIGRPNTDGLGGITAGEIEESNVDLSGEFSNLIVMQRGYQAASNILTTADDMLKTLFSMRSGGG